MCGIYGYVGKAKDPKALAKFIQVLAIVSETRGTDGTGFFAISEDELITEKSAVKASVFFGMSEYFNEATVKKSYLFVGHNRNASMGEVKTLNTQPYIGDEWAFVHNGTMHEAFDLAVSKRVKSKIKGSSDSEAFFRCVEKDGFTEELLNEVSCYSMVAVNFGDNPEVKFARDSHRPMCIVDLREQLGVRVFCSTLQIVKDTLKYTNKAGVTNVVVGDVKFFHTKPLHFYTVDVDSLEFDNLGRYEEDPIPEEVEEEFDDEPVEDTSPDYGRRGYPAPATALGVVGNIIKRVVYGE